MTVTCMEDVIKSAWCPGLLTEVNALFGIVNTQLISSFLMQISHPTFYELAVLQLIFEFYHLRKHVLLTKYQRNSTII